MTKTRKNHGRETSPEKNSFFYRFTPKILQIASFPTDPKKKGRGVGNLDGNWNQYVCYIMEEISLVAARVNHDCKCTCIVHLGTKQLATAFAGTLAHFDENGKYHVIDFF